MEKVPCTMLSCLRIPVKKLSACTCWSKKATKGTKHAQCKCMSQCCYRPGWAGTTIPDTTSGGSESPLCWLTPLDSARSRTPSGLPPTSPATNTVGGVLPSINGLKAVRKINLKILFQKIIPCKAITRICENRVKQRIDTHAVLNYCI